LRANLGDPAICATNEPDLLDIGAGHLCACHFRGPGAPEVPEPTATPGGGAA
jgi:hypothetical protein